MKGYYTPYGYMGYVPEVGKFMLFTSETEYIDYLRQFYVFNNPKPNRNRVGVPTLVFYHGSVKNSIYFLNTTIRPPFFGGSGLLQLMYFVVAP